MKLVFEMKCAKTWKQIYGTLKLVHESVPVVEDEWKATSSVAGKQFWGAWRYKGGLIPKDEPYVVSLNPLNLSHVRGVEGLFYKIDPHYIRTIVDLRGDFGIHRDANVIGSLGCIVLPDNEWARFKKKMKDVQRNLGINSLKLEVKYTK